MFTFHFKRNSLKNVDVKKYELTIECLSIVFKQN